MSAPRTPSGDEIDGEPDGVSSGDRAGLRTDSPTASGIGSAAVDSRADVAPSDRSDMLPEARPIDALVGVMRRLRDPERGCAWDIAQSFRTIVPYTIEEAYEVADAIERGDLDDLRDELGDLLLQVVFHARMAEEQGAFDFDDVGRAIVAKMIRRHPHVFAETRFASDVERSANWEAQKARERAEKAARVAAGASSSVLDGIARSLPALARADKMQRRAARVGFDWPDTAPVYAKLDEELAEVRTAVATMDADALEDELGDVLFSAVNLARHHGVDAETALRRANAKFERRFRRVEMLAVDADTALDTLELARLDSLWERAKRED